MKIKITVNKVVEFSMEDFDNEAIKDALEANGVEGEGLKNPSPDEIHDAVLNILDDDISVLLERLEIDSNDLKVEVTE